MRFISEDGISLEGELRVDGPEPRGSAVICHPHPRHGGSKDHPILWAIRNELASRGLAVLSFNFRGVMGSAGNYAGGHGEVKDVRAAIDRARQAAPDRPSVLCGWSFGANVALREALEDDRVAALALTGIPLRPGDVQLPPLPSANEVKARRRPVLFLAGSHDEYCPAEELREYAAAGGAEVAILEGTNHYLWRRERDAAALIGDFVHRAVPSA
ncbi:MAG: alpha/beta fold hydrolase [Actinomycetota bacterium]